MRYGVRFLLTLAGAIVAVGFLVAGFYLLPDADAQRLSRREMMLGLLTLGVFALAAVGFDMREWL